MKRYVRDLPEPILDESLFPAFLHFCAEPEAQRPLETRIAAAQTLLKLLPSLHFSLFVYLLAFLGQLPLHPENRLNVESISIIFGPALCAARGNGISGIGPSTNGKPFEQDSEEVSNLVNQSQSVLAWLLRHWGAISEKVLDPDFDGENEETEKAVAALDTHLLSPIDLRKLDSPFEGYPGQSRSSSSTESSRSLSSIGTPGVFSRALSSISLYSDARSIEEKVNKEPKRSASFNSISSLMKAGLGKSDHRLSDSKFSTLPFKLTIDVRSSSFEMIRPTIGFPAKSESSVATAPVDTIPMNGTLPISTQITSVLGSLHDLLVSKDKQIERDARELALLRHALLELDDKLSAVKRSCSCGNGAGAPPTPAITITSTPSAAALASSAQSKEVLELQTQLATSLAAIEIARLKAKEQQDRVIDLESRLSKADSEKELQVGNLQITIALQEAKIYSVLKERDLAKDRLEMVKTTLFSVT